MIDWEESNAMREERNCTFGDTDYITCSGEPFDPCSDELWLSASCHFGEAFHKVVVAEIVSKIKNAEKVPRYEPFANRTPLVCEDAWAYMNITGSSREVSKYEIETYFDNGIGTICSPCDIWCYDGNVQLALRA